MRVPALNEPNPQVVNQAIRELAAGAVNATSSVTLTPNATTTIVADPLATAEVHIDLMPLTANAAAALTGLYVSSRAIGTFTLTHPTTAAVDKTFTYRLSRP